jgi:hypothetical protein
MASGLAPAQEKWINLVRLLPHHFVVAFASLGNPLRNLDIDVFEFITVLDLKSRSYEIDDHVRIFDHSVVHVGVVKIEMFH